MVDARPTPQGSLRSLTHRSTGKVVTPQDPKVLSFRAFVHDEWTRSGGGTPADGPVAVVMVFSFRRPDSHYRPQIPDRYFKKHVRKGRAARSVLVESPRIAEHVQKPDVDKLIRATLDALTGLAFHDDQQVISVSGSKRWADGYDSVSIDIRTP